MAFNASGLLTLLTLVSICSCTTVSQAPYESQYTSSFISVSEPGFELYQGDTFAWFGSPEIITDGEHDISPETLEHLRQRFEKRMREQGFQIASVRDQADYWIAASIILGSPVTEQQLMQQFEVAPSLRGNAEYDAGTLVMRFLSPGNRRTQWRGAIEIFTDPNKSASDRQQQVDKAVDTFSRHLVGL